MPGLVCTVVLPDGSRCSYQAVGDSARDRLIDLLRHQDSHLPELRAAHKVEQPSGNNRVH